MRYDLWLWRIFYWKYIAFPFAIFVIWKILSNLPLFINNKIMDRVFKSKVGWWYHLILLIMIVSTVLVFVKGELVGMAIFLLITLQCIHMLLSTWYKITADGNLIVHCSIFPEKQMESRLKWLSSILMNFMKIF